MKLLNAKPPNHQSTGTPDGVILKRKREGKKEREKKEKKDRKPWVVTKLKLRLI